jgi:general secretion pathway protein A
MYTDYYGLTGRPFQLSPNPRFFYAGRAHRRAVAYLTFGLQQGEGFVVITGEVGAGKTTLVAYLEEQLSHQRLFVARINAASLEAQEVLKLVARALELNPSHASTASLLGLIERDLRRRNSERQRVLLVIDEAQSLGFEALEALRVLSNLSQEDRAMVQILLLGQPQLRDVLARPALEQLRQRVVASAHLGPLDPDEVRPYLEHRLRRVGWRGKPAFDPDLFEDVYAFSRGLPRRINLLVARLLVHGAIEQRESLAAVDARELARELEREQASTVAFPENGTPTDDPASHGREPSRPVAVGQERTPLVEVQQLRRKLESVYEDLSRERSRFEDAREEIERLRQELHRIEVERLRIDAATSRRLAQVLAEVGARRDGRSATGSVP